MDPTTLPTDNLYKFAALSGVALIGFIMWLRWTIRRSLEADLLTITVNTAKSSVGVKRLEMMEKIANANEAAAIKKLDALKVIAASGKGTQEDSERVKELAVEFKSLEKGGIARIAEQHPVQEAQAELLALVEGLQLRVKGFRQLTRQCNVGLVVALAWSLLGFGLWYLRLQEPLDLRLKLETDVAMAELQLKKAQLQASARESVTTPPSSK